MKYILSQINSVILTKNIFEELSTKKKAIVSQSSAIEPELLKFESLIGLTVEGLDEDILRFIFHLVNQADYEQEFYFDLNLSSYDYQGMFVLTYIYYLYLKLIINLFKLLKHLHNCQMKLLLH